MKLKNIIEIATAALIGIGATAISVMDLFGVLDEVEFLKKKTHSFELLILGLLAVYLVFERRTRLDELQKSVEKLDAQLPALGTRIENIQVALNQSGTDLDAHFAHSQGYLDSVADRIGTLIDHGAEFFSTTDHLLGRLAEVTVGADTVSTLNLSPHRGTSPALDDYFLRVHEFIKRPNSPLKSFRTLSNIDTVAKAKWTVQRAVELIDTGRISTGVFTSGPANVLLMGFQLVQKKGHFYSFVYPPVNPSGLMDGILIRDERIGQVFLKYFDSVWFSSIRLHEGKQVNEAGLRFLLDVDPSLANDANMLSLKRRV